MSTLAKFSLRNQKDETVTEQDLVGKKTILYAYPKDFTPGCTTEAQDFARLSGEFADLGYQIIGISPDSPDRHERFCDKEALPFDLLSDPEHSLLEAIGAYGEKKNYGKVYVGVIRSTLVIGPELEILLQLNNVKAKGHAERMLREVQNL